MAYWIEMTLVLHLVFCTVSLYEVFVERTIRSKWRMACLILFLPLAGILIFERTMKKGRNRDTGTSGGSFESNPA